MGEKIARHACIYGRHGVNGACVGKHKANIIYYEIQSKQRRMCRANMRWGRCRISAILQSNKKIKSNGSKMFAHLRLSNIQWNDSRQWIVSIRKRFIHDWYRFVWERLNLAALIMETKTHWQLNPILLCLLLLFVEWQKKSEKRIIKPARLAHTAGKL